MAIALLSGSVGGDLARSSSHRHRAVAATLFLIFPICSLVYLVVLEISLVDGAIRQFQNPLSVDRVVQPLAEVVGVVSEPRALLEQSLLDHLAAHVVLSEVERVRRDGVEQEDRRGVCLELLVHEVRVVLDHRLLVPGALDHASHEGLDENQLAELILVGLYDALGGLDVLLRAALLLVEVRAPHAVAVAHFLRYLRKSKEERDGV